MTDVPNMDDILKYLDPRARLVKTRFVDMPAHWEGYIEERKSLRLAAAIQELEFIKPLLPMGVAALKKNMTDAYIVECKDSMFGGGIFRVFNLIVDDGTPMCWLSKRPVESEISKLPPLFISNAPRDLVRIYQKRFDGLTNMFGNGGLYPTGLLRSLTDNGAELSETVWFDEVDSKTDINSVHELAENGGGIRALIDLNKKQTDIANPGIIWVDDDEGIEVYSEPLWVFIDNLMEISATN